MEMDIKTVNVILKNKLTTIFKVCTLTDDRSDESEE